MDVVAPEFSMHLRRATEHEKLIFEKAEIKITLAGVDKRTSAPGAGDCSPSPIRSLIREPCRGTTE
jgi:hypothetical protein